MPRVPELSWKELSPEELAEKLDDTPFNRIMLNLVTEEKARAFLDNEGKIRYQHKPKYMRRGGR